MEFNFNARNATFENTKSTKRKSKVHNAMAKSDSTSIH